jgi:hypothetical protein
MHADKAESLHTLEKLAEMTGAAAPA